MRKDKVVAFRMNDDDQQSLNKCFKLFDGFPSHQVPDTFSKKMIFLLHNFHDELAEKNRAIMLKDKEIVRLKEKINKLNAELGREAEDKQKLQAALSPMKIEPKHEKPKLKAPKVDYVYCPAAEKKVMKVQCDFCKAKDWNKWKACQEFKMEQ